MHAFARAVAGAAALEVLVGLGAWYPWVLQYLQTRSGGPTGGLWHWRNLRFWCFLCASLLNKASQKPQGIQNIPSQRVAELEAAIHQLHKSRCILDSCTIFASYEVTQAQKQNCCWTIQPKELARHRKSSMHRYHHVLMTKTYTKR